MCLKLSFFISFLLILVLIITKAITYYYWKDIDQDEQRKLNKTKKLFQRRKVDDLDKHIFRSMANLLLFFKYLENHPELREIYEEYVKELLGFIGQNAKYEDNTITRLLQSI